MGHKDIATTMEIYAEAARDAKEKNCPAKETSKLLLLSPPCEKQHIQPVLRKVRYITMEL